MSNPQSNPQIEEIVKIEATQIWAAIHTSLMKDKVKFPKDFDGIGAAYGGYTVLGNELKRVLLTYGSEMERKTREETIRYIKHGLTQKDAEWYSDVFEDAARQGETI